MALPFPKKKNNFNSLINNDQEGFWWKRAWREGKKALAKANKPPQSRGLLFEALEPRVLMSAELTYAAGAADLTLNFDQDAGVFQLLSVDANGQNTTVDSIQANTALQDGTLSIGGNGLANTLRLNVASLTSINIELLNSSVNDSVFVQADANFTLSGSSLDIAGKNFGLSGFEGLSLQGGASDNTFTVNNWNGSLALDGGAGNDQIIVNGALDLNGTSFNAAAEKITINAGGSITDASSVTLTALADATTTTASNNRSAEIIIEGAITTTGALTVESTVLSNSNGGSSITSTSNAIAEIRGPAAVIDAGSLSIKSTIDADFQVSSDPTLNALPSVSINATNTARVAAKDGAQVTVRNGDAVMEAFDESTYSAKGWVVQNTLSGATEAVIEGSILDVLAGSFTLSAIDRSTAAAESGGLSIDIAALIADVPVSAAVARNTVNRITDAHVLNSDVSATNGDIDIAASSDRTVSAVSLATAITSSAVLPTYFAVSLGGLYTENLIRGDVSAYAQDSSLTTTGSGAVSVEAADTSVIDATSELSMVAKTDQITVSSLGGAAGLAIAYNAIGWNQNGMTATLDALLGSTFGTEDKLDVQAWLADTTVIAAGDVIVAADSAQQINATVSNAAETTSSALYGAKGGAASGILASNFVSSSAKAYIQYASVGGATPTCRRADRSRSKPRTTQESSPTARSSPRQLPPMTAAPTS